MKYTILFYRDTECNKPLLGTDGVSYIDGRYGKKRVIETVAEYIERYERFRPNTIKGYTVHLKHRLPTDKRDSFIYGSEKKRVDKITFELIQ